MILPVVARSNVVSETDFANYDNLCKLLLLISPGLLLESAWLCQGARSSARSIATASEEGGVAATKRKLTVQFDEALSLR